MSGVFEGLRDLRCLRVHTLRLTWLCATNGFSQQTLIRPLLCLASCCLCTVCCHVRAVVPPGYFSNSTGLQPCRDGTFREGWVLWSDARALSCAFCGDNIRSEPRDLDEHPLAGNGSLVRATPTSCCEYTLPQPYQLALRMVVHRAVLLAFSPTASSRLLLSTAMRATRGALTTTLVHAAVDAAAAAVFRHQSRPGHDFARFQHFHWSGLPRGHIRWVHQPPTHTVQHSCESVDATGEGARLAVDRESS